MRSATCSAARPSVVLIFWPWNMRVDASAQAGLFGQREQQPQRLVRDPVLRVVEMEADRLESEALAAARVLGEERAQVHVAQGRVVRL